MTSRTLPTPGHVERLKQAGIKVWMQIGRVAEAEQPVGAAIDDEPEPVRESPRDLPRIFEQGVAVERAAHG